MKFKNTEVTGFENAILGARLPMCKDLEEAKEKSDSYEIMTENYEDSEFVIGNKDLDLLKRLINADRHEKVLDKLDESLKTKESE